MEAMKSTNDQELKTVLKNMIELLKKGPTVSEPPPSAGDSYKRAEGHWRDCNHKHDQCVANVCRLRTSLATAESKEEAAAEALAAAAVAKTRAAE
eukprot:2497068-Pyramimonas_sp.AAC.1